jgi:hypothetical protein
MQSPVRPCDTGLPDDRIVMNCIAMDLPDDTFPANEVFRTASWSTW